ncbi:hypothetical protein XH87_09295 [Bradyrhizobium sp. CCBAU 53415]|nr:hypothetical protein [Bradyrhizobium sp. CCBAU 53415]
MVRETEELASKTQNARERHAIKLNPYQKVQFTTHYLKKLSSATQIPDTTVAQRGGRRDQRVLEDAFGDRFPVRPRPP